MIRNTGLKYRLATLTQKFGSYNTYWRRTLRQIENGTYLRNLQKIGRDAARSGAEIPEEILASMPKLMREQVKRDREAAFAKRRRQDDTSTDALYAQEGAAEGEVELEGLQAALAAAAAGAVAGRVRQQQKHHHVIDPVDDDVDFDKMFSAMQDDTQSDIPVFREFAEPEPAPPPRAAPPPRVAPSRPSAPPPLAIPAEFQETTPIPTAPVHRPSVHPAFQETTQIPTMAAVPITPPVYPPRQTPPVRFSQPSMPAPSGRASIPTIPMAPIAPSMAPTIPGPPAAAAPPAPRPRAGTQPGFSAPPSRPSQPVMATPPVPPPNAIRPSPPTMPPRPPPAAMPTTPARPTTPVPGAGARPAPARPGTPVPGSSPLRAPPGMNDADVHALHAKYVKAKEAVGQDAGPGSYAKLLQTINAQAPKIMEQYKAKGVEFSVVVKDNQVVIRAKPKT